MKCQGRDLKLFLYIFPALAAWVAGPMLQPYASPSAQQNNAPKLARPIATIKNFNSGVIVFSHDSKMLANGVAGKIQIWDARTWKLLRTLRDPKIKPPFGFSPDGKTITLSTTNNRMQLWDVRAAKPIKMLPGFRTHVSFSPDGSLMAGWGMSKGQPDETTTIWDARTGRIIHSLRNQTSDSDQYVFSLNNKRLIIASVDNFIKIYDVRSGKLISDADAFGDIQPPMVLSPDGNVFATIKNNGFVGDDPAPDFDTRPATDSGLPSAYSGELWNARTGKLIRSFGGWVTKYEPTAPLGFTADSRKVVYNVGEKQAYGEGVHAMIFDVVTGKEIEKFDIANPAVLSPDGKVLVGGDKNLKVWAMPY